MLRYVDTVDGLPAVVKRWGQKQYAKLSLGYCGFHGEPGAVWLGRDSVTRFEAGAFDLLLIDALTRYERLPYAECWLRRQYPELTRRMGFMMLHAGRRSPARSR